MSPRSFLRHAVVVGLALPTMAPAFVLAQHPSATLSPAAPSSPPLFTFHQPVGLNLHHFLYWIALPHGRDVGDPALLSWPETLDKEEEALVEAAVAFYRTRFQGQDLLFGDELNRIKRALVEHDGGDSFAGLGLDSEVAARLEQTLSIYIYRKHLWPAHTAVHQAWIEDVTAKLDRHGEALVERLVGALRDDFPPRPVRVDVIAEGHWAGAFTTTRPVHVVVTSTRPEFQGLGGVEIVFHEATHALLGPGQGKVIEALDAAFAARGAESPEGLWHALLFYTTGWTSEEVFQDAGINDYRALACDLGIYRGPWGAYLPALEGPWQRYLDQEVSLEDAAAAMVEQILRAS